MTRRIVGGVAILAAVMVAVRVAYPLLGISGEGGAPDVDFPFEAAIPVYGQRVVRDTLAISVSAGGQAVAEQQATIHAPAEGPVTRVQVREDDFVRGGQVLLEIDSTEYALRVASARARLAQAEARYREMTLFDDQIAEPQIRAERARVSRAKSGLDEAEVALTQAKMEFDRSVVRAPFPGRVADLRVVPGQWVSRQDELVTLVDLDPIRVEVQVMEHAVGLLAAGRAARVSFAAFPGETFVGRIATINPLVEPHARTARVTVTVPNPEGRILPGMNARVLLEAEILPGRVLVPRSAVLQRGQRTVVIVYEKRGQAGIAREREVEIGQSNESFVEILPGGGAKSVEPGEFVLTEGHHALRNGTPIRLVTRRER